MSLASIGGNVSHLSKSIRRAGWYVWWYARKVDYWKGIAQQKQNNRRAVENYRQAVAKLGEAVRSYSSLMHTAHLELLKLGKSK